MKRMMPFVRRIPMVGFGFMDNLVRGMWAVGLDYRIKDRIVERCDYKNVVYCKGYDSSRGLHRYEPWSCVCAIDTHCCRCVERWT